MKLVSMKQQKQFLNRYTHFSYLCKMLEKRELVIPSWKKWRDRNDSHSIKEYQRLERDRNIFALCMTNADETYHHWRVFTRQTFGVCLRFDKTRMIEWVKSQRESPTMGRVEMKRVVYFELESFDTDVVKVQHLPFLKRWGYRDEREWRLMYTTTQNGQFATLPFPIKALDSIVISPFVSSEEADVKKRKIQETLRTKGVDVYHSALTNSDRWKDQVTEVMNSHLAR